MKQTVATAKCTSYAPEMLRQALGNLLAPLGGIAAFVSRGQRVLLKPNLLSDHHPGEAVTTHPELVRALIHLLKPTGVQIVVADSPASTTKLQRVWEKTGFADLCRDEGVQLLSLEKAGSQKVTRNGCTFYLASPIMETDLIINLPKVKTHLLTTLTCAVKNLYGCIPGYQKATLHKQYPKPTEFGVLLRHIHDAVAPTLTIADGVIGMQGDGPAGGTPAPLHFLAASPDAYALDHAVRRILRMPVEAIPYLAPLAEDALDIRGVPLVNLQPEMFQMPNTLRARLIPRWLVRLVTPLLWIRPAFNTACIRCQRCVKACPVEALSLEPPAEKPTLNPKRCIGCCCCHEVCPATAISMQPSPVIRAATTLRHALKR